MAQFLVNLWQPRLTKPWLSLFFSGRVGVFKEEALVEELTSVLREWGAMWKQVYLVCLLCYYEARLGKTPTCCMALKSSDMGGWSILIPNRTNRHIRRVWLSHGLYFGETQSSQNTHGETKRAWYATEPYQKGMIRYLPYPDSHVGNSDSIVSVWLLKYLSTLLASVFQIVLAGKIFAPSSDRRTPAKS